MLKAKIKVLIADDSVVYRTQIRAALESIGCEVVAVASNGRLALERLRLSSVDLLILDLEMPEMDGIQTLQELRQAHYTGKTLVFSSQSLRGAEAAMEALKLGASDFIAKPSGTDQLESAFSTPAQRIRSLLEPKIEALFSHLDSQHIPIIKKASAKVYQNGVWDLFKPKIVVIGASTGGPTVLETIFSDLKFDFHCPIVIAQHMPPVFTKAFAERLGKVSGHFAKEAEHGDELQKNCIYVAPGDYHLKLTKKNDSYFIALDKSAPIHSVRPAVDPLFMSASSLFGSQCLGVILTGMGSDGKDGCIHLKENGGTVIIQEKSSCVVFGMPGAVYEEGAYDLMATPSEIIKMMKEKILDVSFASEQKGKQSV